MTERSQMDTDLVGAARLESNLDEREIGEALEHPIAGDRPLASARRANGHLYSGRRMAPDRCVHDPLVGPHAPVDDSEIATRHRPGGELGYERVVRLGGLGDDEKSRRVLVEAVHDPRASGPTGAPRAGRGSENRRPAGPQGPSGARMD